jgi:hypothetical protein
MSKDRKMIKLIVFLGFAFSCSFSAAAQSSAQQICNWLQSNNHINPDGRVDWLLSITRSPFNYYEITSVTKVEGSCNQGYELIRIISNSDPRFDSPANGITETEWSHAKLVLTFSDTSETQLEIYRSEKRTGCISSTFEALVQVPNSEISISTIGSSEIKIKSQIKRLNYNLKSKNYCAVPENYPEKKLNTKLGVLFNLNLVDKTGTIRIDTNVNAFSDAIGTSFTLE